VSRIGKMRVELPKGVTVTFKGNHVETKGPLGTLSRDMPSHVEVKQEDGKIAVDRVNETRQARANHGLARSLVQNMVIGVSTGYTRVLVIEGVGYRAEANGQMLTFNVGHSNPKPYELPKGISVVLEDRGAKLTLKGIDKEEIGRVCAQIRAIRPPEPYKGKGIRLQGERVRRKVGKAGVG
jgi:large subunit ribosomal protein L6